MVANGKYIHSFYTTIDEEVELPYLKFPWEDPTDREDRCLRIKICSLGPTDDRSRDKTLCYTYNNIEFAFLY